MHLGIVWVSRILGLKIRAVRTSEIGLWSMLEGAGDLVSRVISALNGVTLIITLLKTNLLSPLPLQVDFRGLGASCSGLSAWSTRNPETPISLN